MMAATVSLAPACVTVRGAAPARGARSALRGGAPPSRRPSWVRASPDDAASAGSDEPKREKKSDGSTAAGEGLENADDWIANWKAGNFPRAKGWKFGDPSSEGPGTFSEEVNAGSGDAADDEAAGPEEENAIDPANQYGGDPNAYAYVFCHNLMSPPEDSFACMYLKDVLGAVNVPLLTPSLIVDERDGEATESPSSSLTVTDAVRRLRETIDGLPDDRPVRLIGSSLGAYVAAVYASDPTNEGKIDRMMLLAPTFKPSACLHSVEKEMGVSLGDAFRDDLKNHPDFPFAPCRAYVVHGYDDEASPLENSLTWVRDASVNLREGTGEAGEVAERRLLEVAGMGHGVENALPQIKSRLVDFFKLPFTVQGP